MYLKFERRTKDPFEELSRYKPAVKDRLEWYNDDYVTDLVDKIMEAAPITEKDIEDDVIRKEVIIILDPQKFMQFMQEQYDKWYRYGGNHFMSGMYHYLKQENI